MKTKEKTKEVNILVAANAMQNCINHNDITKANWYDIHRQRVIDALYTKIPHGSGVDSTWEFDFTDKLIICKNSYHVMNENGYYTGYIDFEIRIKISHRDVWGKIIFSIVGKFGKNQIIKEYLIDTIGTSLESL